MKCLYKLTLILLSITVFSQENNKKFESYLPKNFEINTIISGKFDDDDLVDYLLILNNVIENNETLLGNRDTLSKRKVIILKTLKKNVFKKIYDNDNLVPCREYGGKSDNLYDSLSLKKSIFTYTTCESPFAQDSYKIKTFKLKYLNSEFVLIYYKEIFYKSPEDPEGVTIEIKNINFINNKKKFNFYDLTFYDCIEINKKDIIKINDLAYQLYIIKDFNNALMILTKVIEKSPNRIVAYLNIADCYWETNEKTKAKENYKKYIQLMKEQKKDLKKIPKYVFERIKQ